MKRSTWIVRSVFEARAYVDSISSWKDADRKSGKVLGYTAVVASVPRVGNAPDSAGMLPTNPTVWALARGSSLVAYLLCVDNIACVLQVLDEQSNASCWKTVCFGNQRREFYIFLGWMALVIIVSHTGPD